MNDFDIYNKKLKEFLSENDYIITEEKNINYGIMYRVKRSRESVIRVYQNKKGKITLDTSPVKDEDLLYILADFSGEEKKDSILLPPPLIGTDEAGKEIIFHPSSSAEYTRTKCSTASLKNSE